MGSENQGFFSQHFLGIVIFLQLFMYVCFFINLPLARIVIGIFYLTFIPGLIFARIIRLNTSTIELILFAAGFSIAFLMFTGLAINEVGAIIGFSFPLATLPLSLTINTLLIIGAVIAHVKRGKAGQSNPIVPTFGFHPSYLLLTLIPILSIIGAYSVNAFGNNFFLLLMIVAVAVLFTVGALREKSTAIYPFAILMIALALLFQVSLVSNYILPYGGDAPAEFYVFRTTQLAAHWTPVFSPVDQVIGRYNAMLSITILPTVYSNILGLDPTWVFKVVYPLIFALVPITLYVLWQPYIGRKYAFLASFLFMAQSAFFTELTALNRQITGELFFVLLLILLFNKKIKSETKFIAFGIFSLGLIVSHYALAEIFLFLMFAGWAFIVFYLKRPSFNLQLGMVLFFSVAMFGWYIYTSGSVVFDSIQTFGTYVMSQLGGFFNPASRGNEVLTGLGLTQSPSMLNTISRAFAYITELFIVFGVIALIVKKTKFRFERDYTVFGLVAFVFLGALIAVPGLANALNMTRFYHILLILLSPFCIVGMWSFVQLLFKQEKKLLVSLLVVIVLVPYFLFQTNFVYEVAGSDSWSIPLSGYRMSPARLYGDYGYIDSYSSHGAQWVAASVPYQNNSIADNGLFTSITAYGIIYRGYVSGLTNTSVLRPGEFLYLSYVSFKLNQSMYNATIQPIVNQNDLIYSNAGSEVYLKP